MTPSEKALRDSRKGKKNLLIGRNLQHNQAQEGQPSAMTGGVEGSMFQ